MNENVKVMISASELDKRICELAEAIEKDFKGKKVTLICVLKGAVVFMVDLAKKLNLETEFEFLDISSYGDATETSGIIKINKDLDNTIKDKDVLLIEDILDTGTTLGYLIKHLKAQEPNSLKICTLLDKPDRREVEGVHVDYTGFVIPNEFVIGYGLDYAQKYRNLPFIGVLEFEE